MAQHKRKTYALARLIASPWWISVLIGLAAWLVLFGVLPTAISGQSSLDPLAPLLRALAWVMLLVFELLAVMSFVRAWKRAPDKESVDVLEEPMSKRVVRKTMEQMVIDQDMHTVLVLGGNTSQVDADWNIDALRSLEWKRFELLCAKYYELLGFRADTLEAGADGGIDIRLYRQNMEVPIAIVQCKSWKSQVPVSEIRQLFDIMAHEKAARGIFITSGSYTQDALTFGAANPIQLLDGAALLQKIRNLDSASRKTLNAFAFAGDYTTPTCASCGIKLVKRENRRSAFWGCINYPRCHMTLKIRAADLP